MKFSAFFLLLFTRFGNPNQRTIGVMGLLSGLSYRLAPIPSLGDVAPEKKERLEKERQYEQKTWTLL